MDAQGQTKATLYRGIEKEETVLEGRNRDTIPKLVSMLDDYVNGHVNSFLNAFKSFGAGGPENIPLGIYSGSFHQLVLGKLFQKCLRDEQPPTLEDLHSLLRRLTLREAWTVDEYSLQALFLGHVMVEFAENRFQSYGSIFLSDSKDLLLCPAHSNDDQELVDENKVWFFETEGKYRNPAYKFSYMRYKATKDLFDRKAFRLGSLEDLWVCHEQNLNFLSFPKTGEMYEWASVRIPEPVPDNAAEIQFLGSDP
jgi:hypothetical protein